MFVYVHAWNLGKCIVQRVALDREGSSHIKGTLCFIPSCYIFVVMLANTVCEIVLSPTDFYDFLSALMLHFLILLLQNVYYGLFSSISDFFKYTDKQKKCNIFGIIRTWLKTVALILLVSMYKLTFWNLHLIWAHTHQYEGFISVQTKCNHCLQVNSLINMYR